MRWRETSTPTTIPFWARCDNPFHLFVLTTFFTQVSRVTLGHRAGRSSAFGFAEAELLSASFRPNGLPSRYACCVALTPLSKRHFYEVISCAVKGRTPLRTVHESRPSHGSSPCCFVSMALVVRMVTPLMHKHAVFLAIFPTLLFGFAVVSVDGITVIQERFAQTTTKVLRVQ